MYLFLAALGLCCCERAFSSCDEQGLLSSCGVQAAHRSGFSCSLQLRLWGARAQQWWLMGLLALQPVGSFQTRD